MNWTQVIDPFSSLALSAIIAVVPILFIFLSARGLAHKEITKQNE